MFNFLSLNLLLQLLSCNFLLPSDCLHCLKTPIDLSNSITLTDTPCGSTSVTSPWRRSERFLCCRRSCEGGYRVQWLGQLNAGRPCGRWCEVWGRLEVVGSYPSCKRRLCGKMLLRKGCDRGSGRWPRLGPKQALSVRPLQCGSPGNRIRRWPTTDHVSQLALQSS